ncbi:MAG TPA: hypothetical protein VK203_19730 [Nostocaceae cyanobacterium]|nr:hypothetical protein [Nostocaceae cyanobacterium]
MVKNINLILVGWVNERNPTPPLTILGLMLGFTLFNPTYDKSCFA